jgi:hypothetical protein
MKTTRIAMGLVAALGAALAHERARAGDAAEEFAERARKHYLVGVRAQEKSLEKEARDAFTRALAADTDHAGARHALGHVRHDGRWLTRDEAMHEKGMVRRDGRWVLQEEADILDLPAKQRALRRQGQAKVRELLDAYAAGGDRAKRFARESLDTIEDEHKVEPMAFALRSRNEDVRTLAAEELGRIGNRRALRPLLHRAVFDPSEDVRHASVDAAKVIGDANLIAPLVGALGSESANVRMNAARAIARAGDVRGVKYLVYRFEARGGGAPRAYNMTANQLTFIQDFDVEVASTAFIADPIPGIIQEGTVLDVQVVATQQTTHLVEREVIHRALQHLTGATDVPNETGAWARWFRDNEVDLTARR